MARLSTKKFQDLDVVTSLHVTHVEVFYRKRGNAIGEFFFESFVTRHPVFGDILVPGGGFATLQGLHSYVEACVARHSPVPPELVFVKYARKQPIAKDQLDRCINLRSLEETPLYRNFVFIAKDKEGKIWFKFKWEDEPRPLDTERYGFQLEDFTIWDENKEQELVELIKCAAQEETRLREIWRDKYKSLIEQKHNECTGVTDPKPPSLPAGDPTLQEILKTYS